jgi:hypothetical protein
MYSNIRSRSLSLSPLITITRCHHPQNLIKSTTTIINSSSHSFTSTQSIKSTPFSTKSSPSSSSSPKKEKQTLQSYNDQKQSLKQYRTNLYNNKQTRQSNLPKRRLNSPKNVKKQIFHSWFNTKTQTELYYNREAKRNNQDWKMKVGIMIERLPVVTEDKEDWELDYMYMKAEYDRERAIVYPKEIAGFENDPEETKVLTIEEIYGEYHPCTNINF